MRPRRPNAGIERRAVLVVAAFAAVAPAAAARGQSVHVEVRALEGDIRLPYSTVLLEPGYPARFTDSTGAFRFDLVAPGLYRLVVRAIGYTPFDTTIVMANEPVALRIGLRPLAFELPPVTVLALGACRRPGPPDSLAEPELAAIFDQLRETAARYRLLSDAYPFAYWLERRMWSMPARDTTVAVDTADFRSDVRRPYRPGGLIERERGVRGGRVLRLPTLIDLADSVFHRSHCFGFAGVDSLDGRTQWRVDFLPSDRIRSTDVGGSAWLDTDTYQLHRLTLHASRPERAQPTIRSLEATVAFGELLPTLTVPTFIMSTTLAGRGRREVTIHEEQSLIGIRFLGAQPGRQSP